jgi:hypothetical protein
LGELIKLPDWAEPNRKQIEARLTPVIQKAIQYV